MYVLCLQCLRQAWLIQLSLDGLAHRNLGRSSGISLILPFLEEDRTPYKSLEPALKLLATLLEVLFGGVLFGKDRAHPFLDKDRP